MPDQRLHLVLASSSPFRRELLERLAWPFSVDSPDIDESARPGESAPELVQRLASEKARAVAPRHQHSLIIASDQVAVRQDGAVLGKPGMAERAREQLRSVNGTAVTLETGLALLHTDSGRLQLGSEGYRVHFRQLSEHQINRYVERDSPLGCAGSFRAEGLGITLLRSMDGRDPNTVIGLPLMLLTEFLASEGIALP